jgi:hypothetical protein
VSSLLKNTCRPRASLLDLLSRSRSSQLFLNLIKYARTSSWRLLIEIRDRRRISRERKIACLIAAG